jgi:nicotinamidase-related amidase/glutathione S-transferase
MFEIDESSLPFVRTRHALLALDLQNDFASPNAPLSIKTPPNFVDNILNLASNFRSSGNVIWVRTVYEASRPVNSDGGSESVITDAELPVARSSAEEARTRSRPSQKVVERYAELAEANGGPSEDDTDDLAVDDEDQISETYLTLEPGEIPHVVSPMLPGTNILDSVARSIDTKRDLVFQKTYYSAFKDGSLVQTLRAKFVTEIYICGALTNISVFATAMDAARHGYAITIVDDCLGYRSKARHDEALRKLVEFTGCDIINSADLIKNIRERERAQRAPKPPPRRTVRPKPKDPENIEDLMANLNLRPDGSTAPRPNAAPTGLAKNSAAAEIGDSSESLASSEPAEELKLPQRTASSEVKRERVKTKIKSRRRHSKSGIKDKDAAGVGEATSSSTVDKVTISPSPKTSATTSQESVKSPNPSENGADTIVPKRLPGVAVSQEVDDSPVKTAKGKGKEEVKPVTLDLDDQIEKMAKLSVKEGLNGLCEGDTTIIHDLLDDEVVEGIFERVRDEVRWQKMSHQGGDVPRLVAVQGEVGEDGSIPIYRHPADESPPLLQFSPAISQIRERVEEMLGHPVNHVLIQFYRDGNDYISEHSDKSLDIVPKTFIANVSLGAQRTMVFRTKKQEKANDESVNAEAIQPRQATRAPLPHNSMCRMGLVTNMRWLHGIRPDRRMTSEKSAEELAFNGGRVSLTFRQIGTFLSKDQQKIWGQGAIAKSKKDARTVINGDNAESEKLIRAFGKENHSSEFDWKEHYGEGFDVLHIENSPKLFLSGGKVADLRVKLLLAEYGIEWSEGALSPAFNWKNGSSARDAPSIPENLPVKFVDNDLSKSTVVGDLAIMLYLDTVYGFKSATKSQIDLARQFTRFQQSGELLKKWRATPFSLKPFRRELQLWEAFATEGSFIAGERISLADYALWPLLDEIHGEWDTFDGLENLAIYYNRLKELGTFVKALGVKEESAKEEMSEAKGEKTPDLKEEKKDQKSDVKTELKNEVKKEEKKPESKGKKTA